MVALVIGLVGFFILLYIWDLKQEPKPTVIGSQRYWNERWEAQQRHVGPWDPSAEDTGPTGRIDMTPGGRR